MSMKAFTKLPSGFLVAALVAITTLAVANAATTEVKKGSSPSLEIYLELNGIPGDVTVDGLPNQIAVSSFGWGASNSFDPAEAGGGGAGKANIENLTLTKAFDATSPELFFRTAAGEIGPVAVLRVMRVVDGVRWPYLTIRLENVVISSIQIAQAAGSGENADSETITMAFSKVELVHTGMDGTVTERSWNIASNSP